MLGNNEANSHDLTGRCGARTRACRVGTHADARCAGEKTRREESRRGTHECVRHGLILAILFLAATAALAQSDRSTITGVITDQSGAVIPGASVGAVNQATGLKYSASSNDFGIYALPGLPLGRYKVTASVAGFENAVMRVEVHIAENMTLNFAMKVSGPVVVDLDLLGIAQAVDTASSDNSTAITEKLVTDLPLSVSGNMRNPESFIFLTPGVTGTAANTQIDGSQSRAKEVLFDGVGATSPESGGTLFTYPSVEAVSEFRLVNSDFSAEYGRTGGGFEVFSSKSGGQTRFTARLSITCATTYSMRAASSGQRLR